MTTPETTPCIVSPPCFACRCLARALRRQAAVAAGDKFYSQAAVDAELATAVTLVETDHVAMRARASRGRRFPRR